MSSSPRERRWCVPFVSTFCSAPRHFDAHIYVAAFQSRLQTVLRADGCLKGRRIRTGQAHEELTVRRACKAEFRSCQPAFAQSDSYLRIPFARSDTRIRSTSLSTSSPSSP